MDDPFYSESNMKHLRESLEQSKRGEVRFIKAKDLENLFDNEVWSKPYTDIDEMFKDLGLLDETD